MKEKDDVDFPHHKLYAYPKLYAFWKYDSFPYILGGTVTEIDDEGDTRIEEFGNCCFTPIKILPAKIGVCLKERLDSIKVEYENELKALNNKYKGILDVALASYGINL